MRQRIVLIILLTLALIGGTWRYFRVNKSYVARWPAMGTLARFEAKGDIEGAPLDELRVSARENFERLEKLLSAHDKDSEMNRLFRGYTGAPGTLPEGITPEVVPCYEMAFKLKEISGGAFNPFWKGDGTVDLGAIAKGFALDSTYALLKRRRSFTHRHEKMLLDLGGNLLSMSGSWTTGIRDPASEGGVARRIELQPGEAVATSGEYERGKHIYDGRTGQPVDNDVASVTVVHPNSAMLADGLSTTLFVLGRVAGEEFLARNFPEARAYWIMR